MIIDSPIISGSYSASGSLNQFGNVVITGSLTTTGGITGSISGSAISASYAANATSASYALTASYSANVPVTASYANSATSASYSITSSYWSGSINNVNSASYALTASFSLNVPVTASFANSATSASYALTASYSANVPVTASFANSATSASYAISASYVLNAVSSSFATSASNALTASYLSGYVSPFPYTGSAIISGSLEVTGSANLPNITGSLSGSLNGTASYAVTASNAVTASYLTGYVSPFPFTGSAVISGSLGVTGSLQVTNLSGSGVRYLVADESGSITAQSASAALKSTQAFTSTAGQTTFSVTNGYSTGYVDVFINGSKLSTAEFTDTSGTNIVLATGSFDGDTVEIVKYTPAAGVTNNVLRQLTTLTGSAGQTVFSASYTPGLLDIFYNGSRLSTSDYTANNGTYFTLATGSADNDILDVLVYSYQVGAFNGIGGQGVTNQLAFFNTTSSITGSNSFTVSGDTLVGTASYASNADTLDGTHLSSLATTGSNTFTSAQYISNTSAPIGFTDTASLYTDGGIRATRTSYFSSSVYVGGDLVIFGTQSVNYITSSQLNIADNIITVNTSTPAVRFGGIAVQDSGSLATGLTGSLLWDSQNNHWIYTNPSGSSYSGGMLISGPRNTGSMGDEQGTTLNALMKGMGGDHITSSGMFESGSNVGIGTSSPNEKLQVAGAISATGTASTSFGSSSTLDWYSTGTRIISRGANTTTRGTFVVKLESSDSSLNSDVLQFSNLGAATFSSTYGNVLFKGTNASTMWTEYYYNTSTLLGYIGGGSGILTGANNSDFIIRSEADFVVATGGNNRRMTIGSTGKIQAINSLADVALDIRNTNSAGYGAAIQGGNGSSNYSLKVVNYNDSATYLYVRGDGNVGIGTSSPSSKLGIEGTAGDITSDMGNGNLLDLYGGTISSVNNGVGLGFTRAGSQMAYIKAARESAANESAFLAFATQTSAGAHPERMRITSVGLVGIANSGINACRLAVSYGGGGSIAVGIAIQDGDNAIGAQYMQFLNAATTAIGSISRNGGFNQINYNTTSDYRLKEDFKDFNGIEKVTSIKVYDHKWIGFEGRTNGVIAHELQEVIPYAVSGEKDAIDENGNMKLQQVDYSKLVPVLVKAIQEQQALITALQEKLERNNII